VGFVQVTPIDTSEIGKARRLVGWPGAGPELVVTLTNGVAGGLAPVPFTAYTVKQYPVAGESPSMIVEVLTPRRPTEPTKLAHAAVYTLAVVSTSDSPDGFVQES